MAPNELRSLTAAREASAPQPVHEPLPAAAARCEHQARMPTGLHAVWDRVSNLGVSERVATPGERRRIRLTNQGCVIGIVSCGAFAIAYAIAGAAFVRPLVSNVVATALCGLGLALSARSRSSAGAALMLFAVNIDVVIASLLLGGRVGFLYYFFLFAAFAFLTFSSEQRGLRAAFATLSAACCALVVVAAPRGDLATVRVSPEVAKVLDIGSALIVMGTVLFIVHLFTGDTERAEARLAEEHARSERLLLNILPAPISARLKEHGDSIADGFGEVTVLFADIVGFTELSSRLQPAELVSMLNRIFSAFDDLSERFGLEKIKTIGDAYMVASGLPEPQADHTERIARMALAMRESLASLNAEHGYDLRIRIGIHSGPVVAGVIGKRKFIYDLWGDTVNIASRMESSGLPGAIQVTATVRERLGEAFRLTPRGSVAVKGKGEMDTWLLEG